MEVRSKSINKSKRNNGLGVSVLYPIHILHTWLILVGCPTKATLRLILEYPLSQHSFMYNWTPLEERITNTIESQHNYDHFWLVVKPWPISKTNSLVFSLTT